MQYQQPANESVQPEVVLQQQPFFPDDPKIIQTPKLDTGWHVL